MVVNGKQNSLVTNIPQNIFHVTQNKVSPNFPKEVLS